MEQICSHSDELFRSVGREYQIAIYELHRLEQKASRGYLRKYVIYDHKTEAEIVRLKEKIASLEQAMEHAARIKEIIRIWKAK